MKHFRRGFSLIELLVVISIIALLFSIILASLNTARMKARDARRKIDVHQIVTALNLYYNSKGNWMETGSGCGRNGNGFGWFNQGPNNDPAYPVSMAQCLVNAGAASAIIKDPAGDVWSGRDDTRHTYMKYTCNNLGDGKKHTFIYAKLETVPVTDTATDNTCMRDLDSKYGMNYYQDIVE